MLREAGNHSMQEMVEMFRELFLEKTNELRVGWCWELDLGIEWEHCLHVVLSFI